MERYKLRRSIKASKIAHTSCDLHNIFLTLNCNPLNSIPIPRFPSKGIPEIGDYLVEEKGQYQIVKKAVFEDTYEPGDE